jgi:hypothetical protein
MDHVSFLERVREYSKKFPEVAPFIVQATSEGLHEAILQEREMRSQMEIIALVAVEKRFSNRQEFILGKLKSMRAKLMCNWDWFFEESDKKAD